MQTNWNTTKSINKRVIYNQSGRLGNPIGMQPRYFKKETSSITHQMSLGRLRVFFLRILKKATRRGNKAAFLKEVWKIGARTQVRSEHARAPNLLLLLLLRRIDREDAGIARAASSRGARINKRPRNKRASGRASPAASANWMLRALVLSLLSLHAFLKK